MDDIVFAIMERRVAALEQMVFKGLKDIPKNQEVTELLLQAHTMIASSLSCRETILSVMQRMAILNGYLDPNYIDSELELEVKKQYILELHPELKKQVELVANIEKLKPFADSPNISQVTDLSDKLEELTITNLNTYEESKTVTDEVLDSLQRYNDITMTTRLLFAELDMRVTELELSENTKNLLDD
ncbi:PREDICTED: uncharacterized protein LOC108568950 [Nicrophorus vespilloides]|uniref:Uncharacterized protein LOC108568950 n=1 Tax=Nicrophorus vespilloides TaxID=110193 RepID=A0ABM1NG43_NICVS|nr:PREDICTED: uncharacterized protein LOC108568950 [Nicrophorus vespilloides]